MTTANLTVIGNVLFKRGNTTVASAYTGVPGEIIIDTTLQTIRIQDGVTPGGQVLASAQDAANIANSNISVLVSNAAVQATSINAFNANLGAYQIFANANAATQATSLVSVNANVTAANSSITTLQTQVYANANVSTYLSAFDGNILPAANVTYSLGSEQFQWKDLWVSNNTIYIGNTPVRVDGGTLLVNGAPVATSVTNPVTFANLAAVSGARAFVNDANIIAAGNFGVTISGGGSNVAPVWSDGVNWYIG
jgi:hypothetical protein